MRRLKQLLGRNIETLFIWGGVAMGDYECKPFSASKLATYLRIPRTTVMRRLKQLQDWEMIERRGRYYYAHEKTLNSTGGLRSYQEGRRAVANAARRLSILDTQTG
jgi:DNA-binding IclR family transcriptional regulator